MLADIWACLKILYKTIGVLPESIISKDFVWFCGFLILQYTHCCRNVYCYCCFALFFLKFCLSSPVTFVLLHADTIDSRRFCVWFFTSCVLDSLPFPPSPLKIDFRRQRAGWAGFAFFSPWHFPPQPMGCCSSNASPELSRLQSECDLCLCLQKCQKMVLQRWCNKKVTIVLLVQKMLWARKPKDHGRGAFFYREFSMLIHSQFWTDGETNTSEGQDN